MAVFQNAADRFQENTSKLINLLKGVDFLRCQSQEILQDREPDAQFCNMELSIRRDLCRTLENTFQFILVDMSPIDEKLINLAERLQAYVRGSDTLSAQMAHEALKKGILDIRCNIPQNPDVPMDQYVTVNTQYLDRWITLVNIAQEYDKQKKNLAAQRKLHSEIEQQHKQSVDKIYSRIENDPDYANAFFHILDHDKQEERSHWTQAQRDVHNELVEHRFTQLNQKVSNTQLASLEQEQSSLQYKISSLRIFLSAVPVITDPNQMNKYNESIDQFIRKQAESDEKLAETIRQTERLEASMQHLENTSAVSRQQSTVAESAQKTLENIYKLTQMDSAQPQTPQQLSDFYN